MAIKQQVAEFMEKLDHPLKPEIEAVRTSILNANSQLTEGMKWNAPSFCYDNEDRITFNLHGKGFFRLIFHCGVKVNEKAGKEPIFNDSTGLLDWLAGDRAVIKFTDMNDVAAKKEKLAAVINKWIEVTTV